MKNKLLLIYTWAVMLLLRPLPDHRLTMRFRGFCLSLLLPSCGRNFQVSSTAIIRGLHNLNIGDDVYIAPLVVINAISKIEISSEVMVAFNSVIVSGNHSRLNSSFRFGKSISNPIFVGKGVWIGANSTVTSGAFIHEGVCIGANSCVTGVCDKDSLYGGVPARKIKEFVDQ